MAITGTVLRDEVLANLEIGATDESKFKVFDNLNAAQLQLLNVLPRQFLREAIRNFLFDLETETEYQWPNNFIRFVELYVNYTAAITQDAPGVIVYEFNQEEQIEDINSVATTAYPYVEMDLQGGFRIYPKPTAITKGGKLRYVAKVQTISASVNSELSPALQNLLIFKATALSALVENYRPELAKQFQQMYTDELAGFLPKDEPKVKRGTG